ncbi:hypothetical protein HDG37_007378, partial [Paraburkholderia sp. MM5384-R2]|nr:hypothetical protein [Paraburkholderia sp. MM5384-R2]
RTPETLEAHHRLDDTFDGAVILLDDVVQILVLPDLDWLFPLSVERFERVAQAEAELVIPANGTADEDVGEPVTDKSISSALLPDSTCACPRTSQCLCERDPKECLRLCVR